MELLSRFADNELFWTPNQLRLTNVLVTIICARFEWVTSRTETVTSVTPVLQLWRFDSGDLPNIMFNSWQSLCTLKKRISIKFLLNSFVAQNCWIINGALRVRFSELGWTKNLWLNCRIVSWAAQKSYKRHALDCRELKLPTMFHFNARDRAPEMNGRLFRTCFVAITKCVSITLKLANWLQSPWFVILCCNRLEI